ncbi:aldolase [Bacillus sp. ISL-41]|uniref:aldolase n=1 Tax=Bacillus sp. ISL-41 TaxID=2819127 RepID=UPI001BE9D1AA|nr:aldolase [Bacillus sp. ISL-41]MBT2642181.1 aldolase [Bacillus sp. ISL-41]
MDKVANKFIYNAFGFSIKSEIYFPELRETVNDREVIDIEIRIDDLSDLWSEYSRKNTKFIINEKLVMFKVHETAIFLIEEGNLITISPLGVNKEEEIRLFVLGSCMGAILLQRGILPLHGSAISVDGQAYAIIGNSGAGKSTLASAFVQRGYELITDDITGIYFSDNNSPLVIPSYPQQKLWDESLAKFGINKDKFKPIYQRENKFAIPVNKQFATKSLPLKAIFELTKTEHEEIELARIDGILRLRTLLSHTYRKLLIHNLNLSKWHFQKSIEIISQVNMYQVARPNNKFTANELVTSILRCINKELENENVKN